MRFFFSIISLFILNTYSFSQEFKKIFESEVPIIIESFISKGYKVLPVEDNKTNRTVTLKFELENDHSFIQHWVITNTSEKVIEYVIVSTEKKIYDSFLEYTNNRMKIINDPNFDFAYFDSSYRLNFNTIESREVKAYYVQIIKL